MTSFYIITVVIASFSYVDGQFCNTPNGVEGECISTFNCKSLLTLFSKKNMTLDEADLLRKSQCGYDINKTPKVCCPKNCSTPEGNLGECISIFSCPHLADMLKPPVLDNNVLYVKKSRCKSTDHYSVCCGSAPVKPAIGSCEARVSTFPPDPKNQCCGRTRSFANILLSPNPVSNIYQYPWLAIIEYVQQNKTKLLCGGALINGKYVLTAAHCVTGDILKYGLPLKIRLGEFDIANEGNDCVTDHVSGFECNNGEVSVTIERIIPHPEYNPKLRRHDIALVRLNQTAPFTDFIQPICLPTSDITLSPPDYLTFQAAGWALNKNNATYSYNQNQHVDLQYQNLQKCQAAYNKSTVLWDGQMCAGGEPATDSCKGDSGGPLMFQNGRTTEIVGITSFRRTPCDKSAFPGVYTKVYRYNDWIRNTVEP